MFPGPVPAKPYKLVVFNPKGGSGKTTLATNLAAWCALQGGTTALMDFDPQGCSMRWLQNRPDNKPRIHGVAAYRISQHMTRSWQLRTPPGTRFLVVDTPAAVPAHKITEFTQGAHAVILPVGASDIDIHAAAGFIRDLLLVAKEDRRQGRVAVVANRVRTGTIAQDRMLRFLDTLAIPCLTVLRDSQVYAHSAQLGMGIHEFKPHAVRRDLEQWAPLVEWIERRCSAASMFGGGGAPAPLPQEDVAAGAAVYKLC
jgi:chromosome partitioning protein